MLIIRKVLTIFYSARRNRKSPVCFQKQSVNSSFKWVSKYILFLAKLKVEGRSFLDLSWKLSLTYEGKGLFLEGTWKGPHCEITTNSIWLLWNMKKISSFLQFEIITPPLCCLLDSLKNKQCKAWCFAVNFWIDSSVCQKNAAVTKGKI